MRIGATELAGACDNVADVGVTPTPGFSIKMSLARKFFIPRTKANFQANSNQVCKQKKWFASQTSSIQNRPSFRLQKGGDYSTLGIFSNKSILWNIRRAVNIVRKLTRP